MEDWLQDFNLSEVSQFIEYLDKTSKQCFLDDRRNIRNVADFPGISMTCKKKKLWRATCPYGFIYSLV